LLLKVTLDELELLLNSDIENAEVKDEQAECDGLRFHRRSEDITPRLIGERKSRSTDGK
jgi:hypothetical protein